MTTAASALKSLLTHLQDSQDCRCAQTWDLEEPAPNRECRVHWNKFFSSKSSWNHLKQSNYFVSLNACRYALKLELESIKAQYSLSPSVMFFCHSNLLIGAESSADSSARYELKLLIFLRCFMILMYFMTCFSRSRASCCFRIWVRALLRTFFLSGFKLFSNFKQIFEVFNQICF